MPIPVRVLPIAITLAAFAVVGAHARAPTSKVIASIDLAKPFATRSPWRFTASQGPGAADSPDGGDAPGAVDLCLQRDASSGCDAQLQKSMSNDPSGDAVFTAPRYLNDARVVRPRGSAGPPLFIVQAASMHSGDGDQLVKTQVLAYRRQTDRFERVYAFNTGRNNNQDVRYVDAGPLKGAIISAEPTSNAPYGFWITVNELTPEYRYRQVLKFRSATRYGDGNRLAVVDSEMPNIERRLNLWRPGEALPPPPGRCPKPRLKNDELWCD